MTHASSRAAYDGYAALAPFYDEFVAHPGFRRWVLTIEATARIFGVRGVRLLDIGCGTGRSFAPLLDRGYLVTGVDPVGPMLDQARRRSPRRVRMTQTLVAGAPAGPFDLVLALNDVVNCVPDASQLRATLAAVAARLADDGVFAFDVTPPEQHARLFGHGNERVTARARFAWQPGAPASAGTVLARLRVRPPGCSETVTVHRQRTIDARELRDALAAAGLRAVTVRGCDNDGHLLETTAGAFKHVYFAQLTSPRRRGEEVPDAAGAQASPQGRRHAVRRQAGLTVRPGAIRAIAPNAGPHEEVRRGR